MRLSYYKDKKGIKRFYIIRTVYDENGKEHSETVEKLGSEDEIREKYGVDPLEWAKNRVSELNAAETALKSDIVVKFAENELLEKDFQYISNVGHLFPKKLFFELGLNRICKEISSRYGFQYDLTRILSDLISCRIIHPCSKRSTFDFAKTLLEKPDYELHDVYRSLDVLANEFDFIQSELYKSSFALGKRKTEVIYYDCTNFFFETEEPDDKDGLRQYGKSKENRPLPIVEMGMFIDSEGIPLAMCIHPGNTNEQVTLKPLEKKILSEYGLSKFVFCADAGLSSKANKRYNSVQSRAFVVTQSLKKLSEEYRTWALEKTDWKLAGSKGTKDFSKTFDISTLDRDKYYSRIFYKERWIDRGDFEEKLIVTYSMKYSDYQKHVREGQVERAKKIIEQGASKYAKKNANDFRRFVEKISATEDGEIAEKHRLQLNQERIDREAEYDGFYAVCTDLDEEPEKIVEINKYRWKIEECFRIMKTDFSSRPVYVSETNRIRAHFLTCYLALIIYRYLEKELKYKYTTSQIIDTLKEMNLREIPGKGYIPAYTRTDITDDLHEAFGFRTDYSIISPKRMKEILKESKKVRKHNAK